MKCKQAKLNNVIESVINIGHQPLVIETLANHTSLAQKMSSVRLIWPLLNYQAVFVPTESITDFLV